ncbi:MAG: acyl-CoA dehydrogenase family protein, partial [Mycobacteriales bacterium]
QVLAWAREEPVGPGVLFDVPWVRSKLAEVYALLAATELINLRLVSDVAHNSLGGGDSAAAKVFGTEAVVSAYNMLLEVMGSAGLLRPGTPGAVLHGRVENLGRRAQNNTFGGGTNEVMREIVAGKTLGMTLGARRRPAAPMTPVVQPALAGATRGD